MSIFNRLFGKNPPPLPPPSRDLRPIRSQIAVMCSELLATSSIPYDKTTESQRQLLAGFAFGMVFAVGQIEKLSPPEVHALALTMLMDSFRYADHQAAAFAQLLIGASSDKDVHPVFNAVIHRGIDGHYQWQERQTTELRKNLQEVFDAVPPRC